MKFGALAGAAGFLNFSLPETNAAQTANGQTLIKLSSNENPYGPSPKARQAIIEAVASGNRYAGGEVVALEKLIAEREGVAPENVVLGTGSGEVLAMAAVAYGLDKGEIVTPDPTFWGLQRYAENIGAKITRVPLDANHSHDLKTMRERISANTRLVYVCNPNNPTGTIIPNAELRQFCTDVKNTPILIDEAYLEYLDDYPASSAVDSVRKGANVIVLRTFSKIYGLAGLRVGYGLARKDIADNLKKFRMTWFNPISLRAAIASLQDETFVRESRRKNAETRKFVLAEMDKLKLSSASSNANFIWLNVGVNQRDLPAKLMKANIAIRNGIAPLDSDWARITIGTDAEMQSFTKTLRGIINS